MEFFPRRVLQYFFFLLFELIPKRTAAFDAVPAVGAIDPNSRINTASPPTRMPILVTFMTDKRLGQDLAHTNNYTRIKHADQIMAKKKSLKKVEYRIAKRAYWIDS